MALTPRNRREARRRRPSSPTKETLETTTLREFNGGLDVVDSELNLSGRFATVLRNMVPGKDGSMSIRYGTERFNLLTGKDGTETVVGASFDIDVTNSSQVVQITLTGHGYSTGDHFQITSAGALGGISAAALSRRYIITSTGANTFTFRVPETATSTTSTIHASGGTHDDHTLGGCITNSTYYDDYIVVVDEHGEVARIDGNGTYTRIWDDNFSNALSGSPVGWISATVAFADFAVFAGELIVTNGVDKPLLINFDNSPEVDYLQDLATGANTNVPITRFVTTIGPYVVMAGDPTNPDRVHISNSNTSGTWSGDPAPNDGINVDLGKNAALTTTTVRGIKRFRNQLIVAFDTASVVGTLGIYDSTPTHVPTWDDVIDFAGTVSQRSMIPVGDDLYMLDGSGVLSLRREIFNDTLGPARVSELIDPLIIKRLERLTVAELINDTFAVWNRNQTQYMVFMPNHSDSHALSPVYDPILTGSPGSTTLTLNIPEHGLEEGDSIVLAGLSATIDGIAAADINGTRIVQSVINDDFFTITAGSAAVAGGVAGGVASLTATTKRTGTIGFTLTTDSRSRRSSRWSEFRGLNIRSACVTQLGRLFFTEDHKILRFGSPEEPVYADYVGEYDKTWATSTAYSVGDIVLDSVTSLIYECVIAHTSRSSGTFADDIISLPLNWVRYRGTGIVVDWEMPWADFGERVRLKKIRHIHFDSSGTSPFTLETYSDNFTRDATTGERIPLMSMQMVGGSTGGYGVGSQHFGGGRRTKDERLYAWSVGARIIKLRFTAIATQALKIISVSLTYTLGSIRR